MFTKNQPTCKSEETNLIVLQWINGKTSSILIQQWIIVWLYQTLAFMNLKKEFLCFSNHLWIDSICLGYLSLSRSIAIWSCLNNCDWRKMFKLVGILIFEDPPTHLSQPYNRPQLKLSESTCRSEFDISVSKLLGFETFWFFLMVSVSVSENFGIEKSIGIGFGKIWYRKKYWYRFRKKFGIKKYESVSKQFF